MIVITVSIISAKAVLADVDQGWQARSVAFVPQIKKRPAKGGPLSKLDDAY